MVPKLKQKFQSETDVPDVGKVPEITLKPRDGTLSYLLLRSSSLHEMAHISLKFFKKLAFESFCLPYHNEKVEGFEVAKIFGH